VCSKWIAHLEDQPSTLQLKEVAALEKTVRSREQDMISKALKFRGFVYNRRIWIGVGVLAFAVLFFGSVSLTTEASRKPVAFALQGTATPALTPTPTGGLHPSTTVTATPGTPLPPPGPTTYFSIALFVLLLVAVLAIALAIAFTRPGARNARNLSWFSIGFASWFLVNTLLWVWVNDSVERSSGTLFINPVVAVPFLVNIVALLVLLLTRRWMITLGVFSAIMVNAIGTMLATPVTATYQEDVISAIIFNTPFFLPPFLPALNIRPPG